MPSIIDVRDVTQRYFHQNQVLVGLKNINASIKEGEHLAIVGPSGCGKTTLIRLLAGIIKPQNGHIDYHPNHEPIVGYVPQHTSLIPFRTVRQNIQLPLELIHKERGADYDIDSLLELTRLTDFAQFLPAQLSGGMRQRVAIARALIHEPSVILLDEPFSFLDEITKERLQDELARIISTINITTILVTHDLEEAVYLSDRVIIMTPQPGTIARDIKHNLIPRPDPAKRSSDKFLQQVAYLRKQARKVWT